MVEDIWLWTQENAAVVLAMALVAGIVWRPVKDFVKTTMSFFKDYEQIRKAVLATVGNGGTSDTLGDRVIRIENDVAEIKRWVDENRLTLAAQDERQDQLTQALARVEGYTRGLHERSERRRDYLEDEHHRDWD